MPPKNRQFDPLSPLARGACLPGRQAGLTLIELLVGTALLAIMILSFGVVVSNARKLVSGTQSNNRANSAVAALEQIFREDLRRASKAGFLCLTQANGQPILFFTPIGPTASITKADIRATSGLCAYSLGSTDDPKAPLALWRANWLMKHDWNEIGAVSSGFQFTNYAGSDIMGQFDSSDIQKYTYPSLDGFVTMLISDPTLQSYVQQSLSVNPTTITQISHNWKLLAADCKDLKISWTDGTVMDDGSATRRLAWYDKDNPSYPGYTTLTLDAAFAIKKPEYKDVTGQYRALWTHDNLNNWPKAIRLQFKFNDPEVPAEFTDNGGTVYEVICPVGQ